MFAADIRVVWYRPAELQQEATDSHNMAEMKLLWTKWWPMAILLGPSVLSRAPSGWVATDWIEDIMLTLRADVCDQWVTMRFPDRPRVQELLRSLVKLPETATMSMVDPLQYCPQTLVIPLQNS